MSLRDYIAIHASDEDVRHFSYARTRAGARYAFADAMIAAKKSGK